MEKEKFKLEESTERELIKEIKSRIGEKKENKDLIKENLKLKIKEILEEDHSFTSTSSSLKSKNLNELSELVKNFVIEALTNDDVLSVLKKVISTKDPALVDAFHDSLEKLLEKIKKEKNQK